MEDIHAVDLDPDLASLVSTGGLKDVDVRIHRVEEVAANALGLLFIKPEAVEQVAARRSKQPDLHRMSLSMFRLVASQSSNCSSPHAIPASRSAGTSPCQAGDVIEVGWAHGPAQRDFMV